MNFLYLLVFGGFTVSTITHLLQSWRSMTNVPVSMKWAGGRNKVFPNARACVREVFAGLQSLNLGYNKVDPKTSNYRCNC